ncbi:hypothetical protein [Fusobacterium nucleatum]|uniref:hypothetical protein n=1 Tax=Fusobacterium nucleatum TaxID=851 RepID=UPI0003B8C5C7|nr:hypothetical protein [Fusobacterium nucleatum]ERT42617.1 hypothetical protein HMPREF1538_00175 [Fusobacterium nucleatum CTI-1]
MKILCLTLSMPKNNSWNGKWSGEESYFVRTKRITENRKRKLEILGIDFNKKDEYYFIYDFQDGWIAKVTVKIVSNKEEKKINKKSRGFCMYDWMIDNILNNGKI